ncbi:unannotated protein [freshwater metagenome]|uniref:Unannotated protein n=1 Tax=freshwater metagenome TaxID=449393 RepID=A0A6J7SZW6_9ZZZZ|nr:hypothetical protein [Actinomycetota bacterium]
MKRGLLIVGGTLGGLGAVLAITPPNLSTTSGLAIAGSSAMGVATAPSPTPVVSTSATATQSATKAASSKAVVTKAANASSSATRNSNSTAVATDPTSAPTPTKVADPTSAPTKTATPTPVQTQTSKGVSGVFVGPAIFVNYGTVQVEITVKDGHISDATALQAPTGRNDRWTNMALPILKKQTLAAQSDAIQGASGASYTSYGWQKSLQGALAKAGL